MCLTLWVPPLCWNFVVRRRVTLSLPHIVVLLFVYSLIFLLRHHSVLF